MTKTNLKQWRSRRKWTQENAADYYGIPVSSWRNWEQGRREIPQWLVAAIKRWGKI